MLTKKITFEDTKPLMPLPFLQSVLVPEACVRLIQQDYNDISYNDAKEILFNSQNFGSRVHHKPKDEDEDL